MADEFYRAFEDRYRGSRELIKSRQAIYLPFVEPLLSFYAEPQAIDLGCGRGEWLELLKPAFGAGARGIDLDEGMLAACRQLDLSVANADALTALKELPDESQLVVSGFHIAEHLDFSDLQVLVQESFRVLSPGGLLILETPNPENLLVGSCNFYLDPTHKKPLPSQLLAFLAEYYGFAKVKVLRLQEDKTILEKASVSLRDVLTGVSPDYAVIAQKGADAPLLEATGAAFAAEYGLTAASLIDRYDLQSQQLKEQIAQYEAQLKLEGDHVDQHVGTVDISNSRVAAAEKPSVVLGADSRADSMGTTIRPRLALDVYVLAQGIKTGVYRVCDELFPRLARLPQFNARYVVREGYEENASAYLAKLPMPIRLHDAPESRPSDDADIILSPFGVAPAGWRNDPNVLRAHIIYDLIALRRPDFFTPNAAEEVRNIVTSLDTRTTIFVISEFTKQDLLAYRPDLNPSQVTVIPLAASDSFKPCDNMAKKAEVRKQYGIPADVPFVLSLATLEIRKNLARVVESFALYLDEHRQSNLHLVLSGMAGWKLEELNAALAQTGAWRSRVVVTGFVEDEHLSALYSDALCFVYMSRYEGFGLPPLEAMACGTPVICANNSSLPEVVGDAGVLLDADDVRGVAHAIDRFATSSNYRAELSRLGIARAKLFSWNECTTIVAQKLLSQYQSKDWVMNSHNSQRASFDGYQNGSKGQSFPCTQPAQKDERRNDWPTWTSALPRTSPGSNIEGGLRTQGHFKSGSSDLPLITYVTVVRNNAATLERTIASVQQQTYPNVEHIVLDGASTDGTLDIILRHAGKLDYFASEPDNGLYDALNKAVPLARGDLICILNSDDWLEPSAAAIAAGHLRGSDVDGLLLTGARVEDKGVIHEWSPAYVHPGSYFICANDCHNAIYATRAAYERSGPYDDSYKIAADFKWIMSCIDAGLSFTYTKEATVNYSLGGASGDFLKHSLECMRVVQERFPFLAPADVRGLYHCFFVFRNPNNPYDVDRPPHLTTFLRSLFSRYSSQVNFLNALGWAAILTMNHSAEISAVQQLIDPRSIKTAIQRRLARHPRLYRLARSSYLRLHHLLNN